MYSLILRLAALAEVADTVAGASAADVLNTGDEVVAFAVTAELFNFAVTENDAVEELTEEDNADGKASRTCPLAFNAAEFNGEALSNTGYAVVS